MGSEALTCRLHEFSRASRITCTVDQPSRSIPASSLPSPTILFFPRSPRTLRRSARSFKFVFAVTKLLQSLYRTRGTVTTQLAKLLIYRLFNQINEGVGAHIYAPVQLFMVYGNCPKRSRCSLRGAASTPIFTFWTSGFFLLRPGVHLSFPSPVSLPPSTSSADIGHGGPVAV